jgi:hypothetical protein
VDRLAASGWISANTTAARGGRCTQSVIAGARHEVVSGRDATLVVWSDYDGKGKAWVRFVGGTDAIVGGSRVER